MPVPLIVTVEREACQLLNETGRIPSKLQVVGAVGRADDYDETRVPLRLLATAVEAVLSEMSKRIADEPQEICRVPYFAGDDEDPLDVVLFDVECERPIGLRQFSVDGEEANYRRYSLEEAQDLALGLLEAVVMRARGIGA